MLSSVIVVVILFIVVVVFVAFLILALLPYCIRKAQSDKAKKKEVCLGFPDRPPSSNLPTLDFFSLSKKKKKKK